MRGSIKPPKQKKKASAISMTIITILFAIAGIVFLIIGYHDALLDWMKTMGISLLVAASIPAIFIVHRIIQKRLDK